MFRKCIARFMEGAKTGNAVREVDYLEIKKAMFM